jgi:hypothetical protein
MLLSLMKECLWFSFMLLIVMKMLVSNLFNKMLSNFDTSFTNIEVNNLSHYKLNLS